MTQDKDTNVLLLQLGKILATWRQQAEGISSDSNVLHWKKVNIESFASVIENIGLSPTDLRNARDNYPDLAQKVLQQIALVSNELLNLESDITLGPLAPEIAQAAALEIEEQCKEIKPDINRLLTYHKVLVASSKALKENLNFFSFLPQARLQASGKNKSLFETGYTIYLTVTDNQDIEHEENVTNMFSYINKVTKIQKIIEQTEIPALPALASSFVSQQLNICMEGCRQAKLFINFVSDYFQTEMNYIKAFQTNLDRLKAQPLTELLLEIQSQTDATSKCLRAFSHKKFLLEDIQDANRLLSSVEIFHDQLVTKFIPYLEIQVDRKNGLLNPHTLAAARSRKYFTGLKGLWRFVRMLLFSVSVNTLISLEDLEGKIDEAIRTCSFFFNKETHDNEEISTFIDNFFSNYKTPFPRNELIDITQKCIVTYATILEKVFFKYRPKQAVTADDDEQQKVPTLGRLSGRIETESEGLRKYRQKFEK